MTVLNKVFDRPKPRRTKAQADAPWTPTNVGFGPGEPLRPAAPEEPIRREDYMVGRNVLFTPRAAEPRAVTYAQMRNLADSYGILRTIIEKRKDELKGLEWDIAPANGHEKEDLKKPIQDMKEFWQFPDKENSFDQWIGILAEDTFVTDTLCFFVNKSKKGEVISLDPIDGTTIWMLVNDKGRIPDPPEPAYEQNVKNFPRTWWTKDDLIYKPYNLRSMGLYGFSHVESIILTVNIAFRREMQFLEWFRSSNLPAALVQAPESWNPQQITEWQTDFDNLLAGDLAARSRMHLVPGGAGQPVIFQPLTFDAKFDEWLARVICARFGIAPTPYVAQVNRAQAQTMEEASKEESLVPITQYFKALIDYVIQRHMKHPELQFIWTESQHYRLQDAQLDDLQLKAGLVTPDDIRRNKGLEPYPNGIGSKPMVFTASGPLLLENVIKGDVSKAGGGGPVPSGNIDTPQDGVEEDKQPHTDEMADQVKAELKDWEHFALNRLGKKSVRPFETKVLPLVLANSIQVRLASCQDTTNIKSLFPVEAMKVAYWQGYVRDIEAYEVKAVHRLKDMFHAQCKEALASLNSGAKADLISHDKAVQSYSTAVKTPMEESMARGARDAQDLIKPINPHSAKQIAIPTFALTWLNTRMAWAGNEVTNETELMIRGALTQGYASGDSMFDMADRIRAVFDQCDQVRAERIARTETIAASSQGAVETYKQAGIVNNEWYPALDDRECELCASLAGVHPISEMYTPPAHPNCRCVLLPVLE